MIARISTVPVERLEQSDCTLAWESARALIGNNVTAETPWLGVSEGATLPGPGSALSRSASASRVPAQPLVQRL